MSSRIKKLIIGLSIILSLPIIKIILMATINLGIYIGVIIRNLCEKIVI